MKFILLFFSLILTFNLTAQKVEIKKSTLDVKEPVEEKNEKTIIHEVILKSSDTLPSPASIEIDKDKSTHAKTKYSLTTTSLSINKGENKIVFNITSDVFSDEDTHIIFKVFYKDTSNGTVPLIDTLKIENTYPFKAKLKTDYVAWNDPKRAEVFIGTNFDFFGDNVITDWFGGVRAFLPSITNLRFNDDTKTKTKNSRWGIYAGLYHSRSFTNFGNQYFSDSTYNYGRIIGSFQDTNGVRINTYSIVRNDTVKVKPKYQIDNWGIYFSPAMFTLSHFKSKDESFITNIYIASHLEVIRRTISSSFTYDTLGGNKLDTIIGIRGLRSLPTKENSKQIIYDGYFGISLPIQFLWKDILDLKIVPCIGYGSPGSIYQRGDPWFYLFNFDLFARLGGLSLNLGGEVRGYFPNQSPIFSAFIGTSFSIQKLADFVSKK